MKRNESTMGVNIQGVVYEGSWHNQTLAPKFEIPDPLGGSLSGTLGNPPEHQRITLEINERLLVGQSSSLAERVHEAYGDELEPKEMGLLDRAAEQFGRRLSSEE